MNDQVYAGVKTAIITFVVGFSATLLGFLHNVQEWASDTTGVERNFPSLEPLGKGLVAAAVAALVGLATYVVNVLQANGKLPGKAAKYDPPTP